MKRWSTEKLQFTTLPTTIFPFSTTGASCTAFKDTKNMQSIKPVKGAVASSKPNIPNDVTHPAPNWCLFRAKAGMLRPNLLLMKLARVMKADTKNEGKKSASFVLCLWSASPLLVLIFEPLYRMSAATYRTLLFFTSSIKIIAKSFPP